MTGSGSSPDDRWRPEGDGPPCPTAFDGKGCGKQGPHYCEPRADRFVAFCRELLVHTKGPHKRRPFVLRRWQEDDIARPLFGEVVWTEEWECYVRRYRIAYIVIARKCGKSELAAAILLYLLVGDDEESAEVYGAAKDTKQAGKVFQPALRMWRLSPTLSRRLQHNKNGRRIFDEKTDSYYEVITADAVGELGHNPHGFVLDEVLSQPDDSLWTAMVTARGARLQELLVAITTETNDPGSFGADLIDEAERVQEDPSRAPHVFAFVRKLPSNEGDLERLRSLFDGHPDLPVSCDPFDERNWKWPMPALDEFLSRSTVREDALEARNEPRKENGFRQFHANQRVSQVTRFMPMHLWDGCNRTVWATPEWGIDRLLDTSCVGGLDLSSREDLTAWSLLFDDGTLWWRYWLPEKMVPLLDERTAGKMSQWVKQGWITATDGDVIDYERVYADIQADYDRFHIRSCHYDKWCGEPVRQAIEERTGLEMFEASTTYEHMTMPMKELMMLVKGRQLEALGNPVSRWMADSLEAKSPTDDPERLRPVKPARDKTGKRIDGMVTTLLALKGRMVRDEAEMEPFGMLG